MKSAYFLFKFWCLDWQLDDVPHGNWYAQYEGKRLRLSSNYYNSLVGTAKKNQNTDFSIFWELLYIL